MSRIALADSQNLGRVSGSGIVVQNTRYGTVVLDWPNVRATCSRLSKLVVLESPKVVRRLAIMNFGGSPSAQFLAAKAIVQRSIGETWSERWLVI